MNKINDVKEEDEKHPNKEQNKFDYIFPIPNNNTKLEESKNSDSSYYLYKIPPNNFGSLNLKIPDNLRPKNKDHQNQNHLNFNMSYFSPITISCSINAHSVKRSKLKQKEKEQEFFEKIIKISDVSNIQEFWEVFQHLLKPNQCPVGSDYHIFKKGIVPMWEDIQTQQDPHKRQIMIKKLKIQKKENMFKNDSMIYNYSNKNRPKSSISGYKVYHKSQSTKNTLEGQGRIITDYNKIFPSKNNKVICYDNEIKKKETRCIRRSKRINRRKK